MLQAVHGWSSTYERLVKSQKFFSSYLTQEDLSRFGREQVEMGRLTQVVYPSLGIRFIAIQERVDTLSGDGVEMMPFHNIFNNLFCFSTMLTNALMQGLR